MDNYLNAVEIVYGFLKDGQWHDYRSIGQSVSGMDTLDTFGPVPQILNRAVASDMANYKRVIVGGPKPLPRFNQAQYQLHANIGLVEFRQATTPWLKSSSKS